MFKNCVFKVSVDTRKWVKAAGVRAIRTTAQTALALIPAGVTIGAVDWKVVLSTSILAGAVSLLTRSHWLSVYTQDPRRIPFVLSEDW